MSKKPDGLNVDAPDAGAALNAAAKKGQPKEREGELLRAFNFAAPNVEAKEAKPEPHLNLEPVPQGPGLGTASGESMSLEAQRALRAEEVRKMIARTFSKEAKGRKPGELDLGR